MEVSSFSVNEVMPGSRAVQRRVEREAGCGILVGCSGAIVMVEKGEIIWRTWKASFAFD